MLSTHSLGEVLRTSPLAPIAVEAVLPTVYDTHKGICIENSK